GAQQTFLLDRRSSETFWTECRRQTPSARTCAGHAPLERGGRASRACARRAGVADIRVANVANQFIFVPMRSVARRSKAPRAPGAPGGCFIDVARRARDPQPCRRPLRALLAELLANCLGKAVRSGACSIGSP